MRAFVTGLTGQDGSFLAESLLKKGYEVHGLVRRQRVAPFENITHILDRLHLHDGDVTDAASVISAIAESKPDEVYHFAAQSFVPSSFTQPAYTFQVNVSGTINVLEAVRRFAPKARVFNAASSECFGNPPHEPQDEDTPFRPASPYGGSKCAAFYLVANYRSAYRMFTVNGISYNHESGRRGTQFLTRKIAIAAAAKQKVVLGNLEARRDWGWAPEYVEGFWNALQQDEPDDYVFATGRSMSVKEFAAAAYRRVGCDWKDYVTVSDEFKRPNELHNLRGDPRYAKKRLDWEAKTWGQTLVDRMVDTELERLGGKK